VNELPRDAAGGRELAADPELAGSVGETLLQVHNS
jgi:hypothetical protein